MKVPYLDARPTPQLGYRVSGSGHNYPEPVLRVVCVDCKATVDARCRRYAEQWIRNHKKSFATHKLFFTNVLTLPSEGASK